jgi:transposase
MAVDAFGYPVRIFITAGTTADCKYGEKLIEGIDAESLFADRGYDTDSIIAAATSMEMQIVIPPKKNRKIQRDYDKDLYRLRHLVENAFLLLKQWRGIATRYAKNSGSFLAAVQIHSLLRWAKMHV